MFLSCLDCFFYAAHHSTNIHFLFFFCYQKFAYGDGYEVKPELGFVFVENFIKNYSSFKIKLRGETRQLTINDTHSGRMA
jgi:hypothetical protein